VAEAKKNAAATAQKQRIAKAANAQSKAQTDKKKEKLLATQLGAMKASRSEHLCC